MTTRHQYDVCVIGSGPSGFAAASRACDFGKSVCIIEGKEIGGAGIMNGALTSKTMWELSNDYAVTTRVDRGYRVSGIQVDYSQVMDTVVKAAKEKQNQMQSQIETFDASRSENGNLKYIQGWAEFTDEHHVQVTTPEGQQLVVKAEHFILSTGSYPRQHIDLPIDTERIVDSNHILKLKKFPKRLLIIGGGIVGCEFATIFANFGQTEVHLLDRAQKVIHYEDDDLSDFVAQNLKSIGVHIHSQAIMRDVRKYDDHIDVVLDYPDGHSRVLEVDVIFISIGRVPNVKRLGLNNINIPISKQGFLECDEQCRIKDNIYAVGDISGNAALVNVGEMQGRFAAKSICGKIRYPLRYKNMSTIMFFKPEISLVGLNEKQCQEKGIPYSVVYYSNALINRAIAMRNTNGFIKIIVSDEENPKILGMRAAGPQSSASTMCIAMLMDQESGLNDIMKTIHPHPSITEGIQECLRAIDNKSIFKPKAFPEYIRTRSWKP